MIFAAGSKLRPYETQVLLDTGGTHKFVPLEPEVTCLSGVAPFLTSRARNEDSIRIAGYSEVTARNPPGASTSSLKLALMGLNPRGTPTVFALY